MIGADMKEWLEKTRRFWSPSDISNAKFRKICVNRGIRKISDKKELEQIWDDNTEQDVRRILKDINIPKTSIMLDIGCGIGRIMKPMSQRFERIIGIDVAYKMIEFAQEYLNGIDNIELFVNDGISFPKVQDKSIDFVYSMLTFQHMTSKYVMESNITEISRILKSTGKFRIQTMRHSLDIEDGLQNDWKSGDDMTWTKFIPLIDTWLKMIEDRDMKVLDIQPDSSYSWLWTTAEKRN